MNCKSIVIYSFESDFYKTLKLEIEKSILDNFEKYVKLSPLGGYVSIETRNEVFMDSNFSIFGADSGKLYASDVMGVQLSWAPDDSKVCYYYTKETEKLEVSQSSDIDVISKRVGYYDVISKEIEYIDSTESEKNMVSQIYWSSKGEKNGNVLFKGKNTSDDCEIYYINKLAQLENMWGTPKRISIYDKSYDMHTSVGANGTYRFSISNSMKLHSKNLK